MKITIENKQYEVDLDRAVKDGYLKQVRTPITNVEEGDIFTSNDDNTGIVAIAIRNLDDTFSLADENFSLWSDNPRSRDALIAYLDDNKWYFAGKAVCKFN